MVFLNVNYNSGYEKFFIGIGITITISDSDTDTDF